MTDKLHIKLTVNGQEEEFLAEPRELLIYTLRERLNITGPHIGCETSHCGACTITMDGKSVKACTVFIGQANGADVTTIEGMGGPDALHPLQSAFKEHHGLQCGYCTPGMITRAAKLLEENPSQPKKTYALECRETCAAALVIKILSNPFSPLRLR